MYRRSLACFTGHRPGMTFDFPMGLSNRQKHHQILELWRSTPSSLLCFEKPDVLDWNDCTRQGCDNYNRSWLISGSDFSDGSVILTSLPFKAVRASATSATSMMFCCTVSWAHVYPLFCDLSLKHDSTLLLVMVVTRGCKHGCDNASSNKQKQIRRTSCILSTTGFFHSRYSKG